MTKQERDLRRAQVMISYITLPFVLAIPPIIGWYIGSWIDKYFDIAPYGMYTLLVLGIISGVRECYRIVTKYKDEEM